MKVMMFRNWVRVMNTMIMLYEKKGDQDQADAFADAIGEIMYHKLRFKISLKTIEDIDKFKGVEGIDSTTLELFREFVMTGEMKRLKDLKGED